MTSTMWNLYACHKNAGRAITAEPNLYPYGGDIPQHTRRPTVVEVIHPARARRGPAPAARLPWWPVAPHIEDHQGDAMPASDGRRGIADWGRLHGINPARLHDWKRNGLTVDAADRIAEALGRHPVDFWGRAYYDAIPLDDEDEVAA